MVVVVGELIVLSNDDEYESRWSSSRHLWRRRFDDNHSVTPNDKNQQQSTADSRRRASSCRPRGCDIRQFEAAIGTMSGQRAARRAANVGHCEAVMNSNRAADFYRMLDVLRVASKPVSRCLLAAVDVRVRQNERARRANARIWGVDGRGVETCDSQSTC